MDCLVENARRSPDGCCLDICAVTEEDMRCMVRSLLPPGEAWDRSSGSLVIRFADILAARAYEVVQALCTMIRESDPCTAIDTVDQWAALYGVPPEVCDLALGCSDPGFLTPFQSRLICIFERLQFGQPITCCFLHEVGHLFGVDVCCWPQPVTESPAFCVNGGEDCEVGSFPIMTTPSDALRDAHDRDCTGAGWGGMSSGDGVACCSPRLPIYFKIITPFPPEVVTANCGEANDLLCRDVVVETVKCLINFLLPAGVRGCFIVSTA